MNVTTRYTGIVAAATKAANLNSETQSIRKAQSQIVPYSFKGVRAFPIWGSKLPCFQS